MAGGIGDELYIVSSVLDQIVEAAGDLIGDFANGVDRIEVRGYGAAVDAFSDVTVTDLGADVRIDLSNAVTGAGFILLAGIADPALIDAGDFAFVA